MNQKKETTKEIASVKKNAAKAVVNDYTT